MAKRRSKRLRSPQLAGRKEPAVTPCTLEQSQPVVLFRILGAALLFTGLAWLGLQALGGFGGRRLVRATIAPLVKDLKEAQLEAIRRSRPRRVDFTDLASAGRYRIEAYIPGLNDWREYPDATTAPKLWQPVVERVLYPKPEVTLRPPAIVYIRPEGCFSDQWRLLEDLSQLPPIRYSFQMAGGSVTVNMSGQEVKTENDP